MLLVIFETGVHEAQAALHLDSVKDDIELLIILLPFVKLGLQVYAYVWTLCRAKG